MKKKELVQNFCDQVRKALCEEKGLSEPPTLSSERILSAGKGPAIRLRSMAALGMIIWDEDRDIITLVNKDAHLPRRALDVGFTTKRGSKMFAGKFGEGLKGAIVVAVREGRTLEIHQAGRTLSFFPSARREAVRGDPSPIGWTRGTAMPIYVRTCS